MIYLVIIEKLTPEGRKDFKKVLEWQKRFDEWLVSHSAAWKSVKHFVTEVGEPAYETWLGYPNYKAIDEDEKKSKEFAQNQNVTYLKLDSQLIKLGSRNEVSASH